MTRIASCRPISSRKPEAAPTSLPLVAAVCLVVAVLTEVSTLHAQPAAPNYLLSLGGTNGFLELASGAFNDLEEVTIEGWVKWMDDRPWRRFFDFGKEGRTIFAARLGSSPHIALCISPRGGWGIS